MRRRGNGVRAVSSTKKGMDKEKQLKVREELNGLK